MSRWGWLADQVISPHVIEVWEAALTLAQFPVIVLLAWYQDKGGLTWGPQPPALPRMERRGDGEEAGGQAGGGETVDSD